MPVRSVTSARSLRVAPLLRAIAVPATAVALVAASCVQAQAATPVDGPLAAAVSALAGAAAVSGGPGAGGGSTAVSCQTRAEGAFGEQVCYSARPGVQVDVTAALRGSSLGRCPLTEAATGCELTGTADGWRADASYRADFGAPSVSSAVRICAPGGSCTTRHRVYRF